MSERRQPNQIDYVELPIAKTGDLPRAKAFYENVFGWSYADWGDDYADTKDSGVGSGLNADASHRPPGPLVVVYATNLEDARSKVVDHGGQITRDLFAFPGGRRFHFQDPSGNELAVWSDQ
ncbi:MAG: VOC family protein [Pirellulales bacterium]|nr:VOC family protein [Pirellulales bacterium]